MIHAHPKSIRTCHMRRHASQPQHTCTQLINILFIMLGGSSEFNYIDCHPITLCSLCWPLIAFSFIMCLSLMPTELLTIMDYASIYTHFCCSDLPRRWKSERSKSWKFGSSQLRPQNSYGFDGVSNCGKFSVNAISDGSSFLVLCEYAKSIFVMDS